MEYWYLWLLLIVLCVITVFVLSKASAAAKKHNNERDALLREYDRKKALKDEFSFLTREKAESSDPETLFEGVSAVLQAKTEKAEDPEKVFGKFTETQKYIYTLYYFLEDTESGSLSFFFKNNGEPLTSLASKALCAVGENELSLIVEKEFSMYDENNEEVSVDKDEIERLIDAINQSLPNELESARRIVADKERIMLDAEKKAEDTVAQAKDYIARITEESELVKQAQERANEVISSANKSAEELRTSSVTYATDVLKYVETNMENVLDSLKKNRQSLIDSNSAAARQQQEQAEDNGNKK